jgi:hypothetical protein
MRLNNMAAVIIGLFILISSPAWAGYDLTLPSTMTQSQFDNLSQQLGLAISYTPLAPAAPLGLLGFDIGIEVTAANIDQNQDYWKNSISDTPPNYLVFPKIHAQKGLPLGIDVGVVYAKAPGTDIGLVGGEIKWAFFKGGMASPAVAIRGDYTQLIGVDDISMKVYGADISISKGFGFLTPYAGVGEVWSTSEDNRNLSASLPANLKNADSTDTKSFVGFKMSFFVVSFVAEADFSKVPSYSGRLNLSF